MRWKPSIRAVVKSGVARGHVQIHLTFARTAADREAPLNRPLLDAYLRAFREASQLHQLTGRPDLNAALRIPGMLSAGQADSESPEAVSQAVLQLTAEAVQALNAVREREGEAMVQELQQRSEKIRGVVERDRADSRRRYPGFSEAIAR